MAEPLSDEDLQEYDQYHPNEWTEETEMRLRATIDQDRARRAELEADIARRQRNDHIWWEACRCAEHPDVNARGNNMWGCPDCLELIKHDNAQMETALRAARAWIMEVLREENEASPENTHTVRQIDEALAGGKPLTPEADLPSIKDICGLWADEKDEG